MSFSITPNEILLQIASYLPTHSLSNLLQTSPRLATLLTPILYFPELTLDSKSNPRSLIKWYAPHPKPRCITLLHLWSSKSLLYYLRTLPPSIIEHVDSDGRTLLHHAIEQRNTTVVEILLEKGPDVNREDKLKRSYLSLAIITLNTGIAQLLISSGAEIENSHYMGFPLSCLSVSYNNLPLAQCVISGLQKQKQARGETLFTPLPNPNSDHHILHHALYPNNNPTISYLLSLFAPTSTISSDGTTPLHLSIRSGNSTTTNHLLSSLPPTAILAKTHDSETPLHFLSHSHSTHLTALTIHRLISQTLSLGGSISPRRKFDLSTPLHISGRYGNPIATQLLLENGANPFGRNSQGLTPLLAALELNTRFPIEILQRFQDRRRTVDVLIDAMAMGCCGDGYAYLSRGDSLILRLNRGTALHFAARAGDLESVKQLIEKGADVLAGDAVGRMPLECALGVKDSREVLVVQVQDWLGVGVGKDVVRGVEMDTGIGKGKGKTRKQGEEGEESEVAEALCLGLAKAMWERGYDFSRELKAIKRYKAPETTWLELAALVGMETLERLIREAMSSKEVEDGNSKY
ncbi:hypothetical protein IFR04_008722 [Cadophora malorum]|uniref:F-box domain-containing protein n=1 Tax=Cadophora malorum TaxID=108018 RepID=A0A8H7TAR9_9HELO|nr:hypothetical protein IFR04_008722 [Cadophora malorum]